MSVTVGFKLHAASRTNETVYGFAVHGFGMGIPPCQTAFIGAETFPFCALSMFKRAATIDAYVCYVGLYANLDIVSAAVGFDCVLGHIKLSGDGGIAVAFAAQ